LGRFGSPAELRRHLNDCSAKAAAPLVTVAVPAWRP